ncbi:type II CAAX endopeptidase family protein [Rothia sp. LK2588]|uniref:lysostaphin resistance A-like protein n=1 Tax=Rothia sp. LK2588 TaxID=3114369 RepID=UPI0034CE0474
MSENYPGAPNETQSQPKNAGYPPLEGNYFPPQQNLGGPVPPESLRGVQPGQPPVAPPVPPQAAPGVPSPPVAPWQTQAPAPYWAPPAPPVRAEQLQYHRLALADLNHRWWKPLVEALIAVPIFLVLSVLIAVAYLGHLFVTGQLDLGSAMMNLATIQDNSLTNPATFLFMFTPVIIMWPALWIGRLCMGPRPWGLIHSVAGRIRWGWLVQTFAISIVLYVIIPTGFELLNGAELRPETDASVGHIVLMLALVLLIVPFQCYAEELVFRGYLMQTIGRWLKHPAFAIVLPAPLFMLGHAYDFWGQASILVMGIAAGFMAWYTGGLEAGIAMHVVNNLNLMALGVLGLADPFAQSGVGFTDFLFAAGIEIVLVLVVMFAARKAGVARSQEYRVVDR